MKQLLTILIIQFTLSFVAFGAEKTPLDLALNKVENICILIPQAQNLDNAGLPLNERVPRSAYPDRSCYESLVALENLRESQASSAAQEDRYQMIMAKLSRIFFDQKQQELLESH